MTFLLSKIPNRFIRAVLLPALGGLALWGSKIAFGHEMAWRETVLTKASPEIVETHDAIRELRDDVHDQREDIREILRYLRHDKPDSK